MKETTNYRTTKTKPAQQRERGRQATATALITRNNGQQQHTLQETDCCCDLTSSIDSSSSPSKSVAGAGGKTFCNDSTAAGLRVLGKVTCSFRVLSQQRPLFTTGVCIWGEEAGAELGSLSTRVASHQNHGCNRWDD